MQFVGHTLFETGGIGDWRKDFVPVFTDQLCLECGHPPCYCCVKWCDVLLDLDVRDEDGDAMCCGGKCTYAAEPQFYGADGFTLEWEPMDWCMPLRLPWRSP